MSRTSLTIMWEKCDRFHSSLAYYNTMHQCMTFYYTDSYAAIRFKRYEPAEIPF